MAKILLTGASGFIGTHLYPALQQAGGLGGAAGCQSV
jgi:nucleoside-diphosphate-sugar epimerase